MVRFTQGAQVSLEGDRAVLVKRDFQAPKALVYEAYTTPKLVQKWLLGPPGWTMPVCEMDVRPGGLFRWRWRSDEDGQEFGFHGEFLEVDPGARIVHSEFFDAGDAGYSMGEGTAARVTLTLEETDGVTTLSTLIEYPSQEALEGAMASGMTDGMEMSYKNLDALLNS